MAGVRWLLRGKLTRGAGKGKEQEESCIQAPPCERKQESGSELPPGTDGKGKWREALVPVVGVSARASAARACGYSVTAGLAGREQSCC